MILQLEEYSLVIYPRRRCIQKEHYVPSSSDQLVTQNVVKGKQKKSKTLTFQRAWLQRYPWLVYSPSQRGGFCKYCVLFPSSTLGSGSLVTKCFNNLKKATGKDGVLQCHGELQYHKDALAKGDTFISTYKKPVGSIPYVLSTVGKQNYSRNVRALESIVKAVLLCGRQNIPLRGHRDGGSSISEFLSSFIFNG